MEFRLPVLWDGLVDLNGKDPLVDSSAVWVKTGSSDRQRMTERHRRRRRTRVASAVRARIRLRMWLACTGALVVITLGVYFVLGHQAAGG
jgi:hypothetical protein